MQAVQQLYAREMRGALEPGAEDDATAIDPALGAFAKQLLDAARQNLAEIDRLLTSALQNWNLRRLGAVDRAILRLAVAEMLTRPEIPPAVTINEAIEIARNLATEDSSRFANGVLDRVRKEIGRDARSAS